MSITKTLTNAMFALLIGVMVATTGAVSAHASDSAREVFWQQMLDRE